MPERLRAKKGAGEFMGNQNKEIKIEAGIIDIFPNIGRDKLDGKTIHEGSFFMREHFATATIKREGKEFELDISAGMDGATIIHVENGRFVKINLNRMVNAAADAGLFDEVLNFKSPEKNQTNENENCSTAA